MPALSTEHAEFDLGPIQSTIIFGRVVKGEPLGQAPRLGWRKRFIKGGGPMRVQVVQHHRDPFRRRIVSVGQIAHGGCPLDTRAPLSDPDLAPARERLRKHKQMGHALPLV
jgi:hypothetical protein